MSACMANAVPPATLISSTTASAAFPSWM